MTDIVEYIKTHLRLDSRIAEDNFKNTLTCK